MEIAGAKRRPKPEGIVPMINVVFLMLIFFLMTAEIAPPEPIDVSPPSAEAEPAVDDGTILFVGEDTTLAFGELRGETAIAAAVNAAREAGEPLHIRADRASPAIGIARTLASVQALGPVDVYLMTARE